MSNIETQFLPSGFRMVIVSSESSYGYYNSKGNPGEQPGRPFPVASSTTVVVESTNASRTFEIVSVSGFLAVSVVIDYVDEAARTLVGSTDVVATDVLTGDVLQYDGQFWINQHISTGVSVLDDLTNVNTVAPDDGEALIFDSGVWSNAKYDYNNLLNLPSNPSGYTDEQAQDAAASLIQNGTGITWSYDDFLNFLTPTVSLASFSTSALTEGSNLYYTQARFDTAYAAKSTSDVSEGTNLYYTQARFDTAYAAKSTSDVSEGTNLYYTQARFDTAFAAKSTSGLSEGSNLYYTQARFDTAFASKSTSGLSEGTNLYYTQARFDTAYAAKSTSDVSEGSNLYHTQERAQDAAGAMATASTFISATYNDASNTLTHALSATGTANSTTFLRGDNQWIAPAGGGGADLSIMALSNPTGSTWLPAPGSQYLPGTLADQTIPANTNVYFVPYILLKEYTFDRISVASGASNSVGNAVLGVYESDPTTKLPTGSTLREAVVSLIGANGTERSVALSSNLTIGPGLFYLAFHNQTAGTIIKRLSVSQTSYIPNLTAFTTSGAGASRRSMYIMTLAAYTGVFQALTGSFSASSDPIFIGLRIV